MHSILSWFFLIFPLIISEEDAKISRRNLVERIFSWKNNVNIQVLSFKQRKLTQKGQDSKEFIKRTSYSLWNCGRIRLEPSRNNALNISKTHMGRKHHQSLCWHWAVGVQLARLPGLNCISLHHHILLFLPKMWTLQLLLSSKLGCLDLYLSSQMDSTELLPQTVRHVSCKYRDWWDTSHIPMPSYKVL